MSLRDLARAVGVTPAAVCRWENASAKPRKSIQPALATALEVSEAELIFGLHRDDEPHSERLAIGAPSLPVLLARAKELIASAAGTTPSQVTIMIEV